MYPCIKYVKHLVEKDSDRLILKECLKEKDRNIVSKEREEYLRRNGYSQQGIVKLRERGENIILELTTRDKQVEEQFNKTRNAKYNTIYKFIGKIGLPGYLEGKGRGESQKLTVRARCGNLEERNKYWMNEDGKLCDLCLLEGTVKHKIEECQKL